MEKLSKEDERRRNPRFNCGGTAKIRCLPLNGIVIPGKLRNLSLGGICVDAAYPIALGTEVEILVSINADSFRTIGAVKAISERSRASMEFVTMSASGKEMLAELCEQFSRIQQLLRKLRSERQSEDELLRDMTKAGIRAALLGELFPSIRRCENNQDPELKSSTNATDDRRVESLPLVIKVDLFG